MMASNEKSSAFKTRGIQKNKTSRIITVLRTNKTDRIAAIITTSDHINHTIAKNTRTNAPAMIAADHLHEIAPTHRRAALAITPEMEHHSMMRRINTRNK
jgi:hypothetical protein